MFLVKGDAALGRDGETWQRLLSRANVVTGVSRFYRPGVCLLLNFRGASRSSKKATAPPCYA